jgi:hypothetical protein
LSTGTLLLKATALTFNGAEVDTADVVVDDPAVVITLLDMGIELIIGRDKFSTFADAVTTLSESLPKHEFAGVHVFFLLLFTKVRDEFFTRVFTEVD